ncbi:patatin-like phospholipase family protein [Flavobacterium poyangense]|uniref:patatin-like phospholipase family protein n=1 Tax=Flavobacterium poyangense TaxID=2204302 RepID=UPI001423D7B7|nr:patatin-like phospholipase family protein [Flavobacterium sp. JXAS1]
MDIVTDLTAEAISYLTLFQDILKSNPQNTFPKELLNKESWKNLGENIEDDYGINGLTPGQIDMITDLVWHSPSKFGDKKLTKVYLAILYDLLKWLAANIDKKHMDKSGTTELLLFRVPFFWRQQIRAALYKGTLEERKKLVEILRYMPVQVVQAMAGQNKSSYEIRLYQFYVSKEKDYAELLSDIDLKNHKTWWSKENREAAIDYLTNDKKLLRQLLNDNPKDKIKREFTLPFETLFNDELNEIEKAREKRRKEWQASVTNDENIFKSAAAEKTLHEGNKGDPMIRAVDMKLLGIAFSGGGIRSATFNLGILQRLASLDVLEKIDYISTVSGGGYIGTWYTSWIKRSGSFSKVTDQLCPEKSSDPFADEVRPIRWLRMFSNYLSPNVGMMSPDAWTSGMTWLRNTLVNQTLLLLVLLTVFSLILDLYKGWEMLGGYFKELEEKDRIPFFWLNTLMLSVGALIAALAMRSYYKVKQKRKVVRYAKIWNVFNIDVSFLTNVTGTLPYLLIIWTIICAFLVSTFIFNVNINEVCGKHEDINFWFIFNTSLPSFIALIFVAFMGNYHKRYDLVQLGKVNIMEKKVSEDEQNSIKKEKNKTAFKSWLAIITSSAVASMVLGVLLYLFWKNYEAILVLVRNFNSRICTDKVMLLFGLPIVLEIFSIAIITRMAIMGRIFPDYRREWWGRTGGYVNRFILFWILICFGVFIMPDLWANIKDSLDAKKVGALISVPVGLGGLGGWAAIVAWGVKKAFESKETDDPTKSKSITNTFVKMVPFIFMIGVLLIGSAIINVIREGHSDFDNLMITVILFIVTLILSSRVGVNEFSLHHFYRNRLIRAFMGATRTREDRIKTANAFTGFDTNDDILLSSMQVKDGYFGPYPILNTALNATVVSALDRQDRKAESFVFTPLYCGYDFSPTRPSTYDVDHVYEYGYRPTNKFSNEKGGPTIGTAMAISGAAVNPNWGYHSSAPMAFLLTIFNVRLGWWIGNTRLKRWKDSDPRGGLLYLIHDLTGKSDINMDYVCLSDGGHFDNMGLYELIRRRCRYIILGDGEQDQDVACEGLANAIRRCRIDFGVEIVFDNFEDITKHAEKSKKKHILKGKINYPGTKQKGILIYIKAGLTGDEPIDIREYALANPDFPQQSTADQFFDEAQFESYRKLGYHSIKDLSELHLPSK